MTVVINGSLHNVEQAAMLFPHMKVIMLKMQIAEMETSFEGHPLIVDEEVRLEWVSNVNDVYCPYILTLRDETAYEKSEELLFKLIEFNESCLDKVI